MDATFWLVFIVLPLALTLVMLSVIVLVVLTKRLNTRERLAEATAMAAFARGGTKRVAMVTGANAGIGFALTVKLATAGIQVVMACRNKQRAEDALARVKKQCPNSNVSILLVDVSDFQSVLDACKTFRKSHSRLDWLFCNAGIFPVRSYRLSLIPQCLLTCQLAHFLETGRGRGTPPFMTQPVPSTLPNGLDTVFATHVAGHVALINGLKGLFPRNAGRVIWTGSRAACPLALDLPGIVSDLPAPKFSDPYGSAKTAQDLVCHALDDQLRKYSGARSFIACPGYVSTEIAPPFMFIMNPIFFALRSLYPFLQVKAPRSTSVFLQLATADSSSLRGDVKYAMAHGRVAEADNGTSNTLLKKGLDGHCGRAIVAHIEKLVKEL